MWQISALKKQIVQKDQALLEKDKQVCCVNVQMTWDLLCMLFLWVKICQLRADTSEKERDFRTKQQSQQRAHGEQVEQLKVSGYMTAFFIIRWNHKATQLAHY